MRENLKMQIQVAVNDVLMNEVLAVTHLKSKEEAIEQGLKLLLQVGQQRKIKNQREQLESKIKSPKQHRRYSLAELLEGTTPEIMSELNAEMAWARDGEAVGRELA
jgi:antitoxin ChpS